MLQLAPHLGQVVTPSQGHRLFIYVAGEGERRSEIGHTGGIIIHVPF